MVDQLIRAGGAILWREGTGEPEVALIHRPKYDDWTFPKGKLKNGEHLLRGVVREVEEEAGVRPVLGRRLPPRSYLKDGRPKRVDYWAATGGTGNFTATGEVDQVVWLPMREAEERLTYDRDVDLLQVFAHGPIRTTPYIILRHTSAGAKREWDGDDVLRPLDARGRDEAGELAGILALFGPAQVISSATARCVETVLPYAARTGTEIRSDRAFTVGVSGLGRAAEAMAWLLTEPTPTIICTHGELVSELVLAACRKLGAAEPEEPGLRKGGFWVLHVADGTLAAMERH